MAKILHFSPVRKPPGILKLHLNGLRSLKSEHEVTFSFFDDNIEVESSRLLGDFLDSCSTSFVHSFDLDKLPDYRGEERWVPDLYARISYIKNRVIDYFLKSDFDFLFLTDSDLIIHPQTVDQLVLEGQHFCSMIFWTQFEKSPLHTPNAWFSKPKGFDKNDLLTLRDDKTIRVDYTGACTMLSRKILEDGVSFEKIPNVAYLGEDKHFCIRAAVMGYSAFVSTTHPAFHVYNEDYIKNGKHYLESGFSSNYLNLWLDKGWEDKIEEWLSPRTSILKRILRKYR